MRPDTTRNSWKTNLFLITTTAAVTAGLMTLYNRYQDSKKSQDVRAQQDAGTQTDPVQTPQDRRPGAAKKPLLMKYRQVPRIPFNVLLRYADEAPLAAAAAQSDINSKPNKDALFKPQSEEIVPMGSSQPISPRGKLPCAEVARLFNSRNSSYALLPSRVPSVEEDLDKPKVPGNSEATITADEQEKRGAQLFATAVAAEPVTSAAAASSAEKGWRLWPF